MLSLAPATAAQAQAPIEGVAVNYGYGRDLSYRGLQAGIELDLPKGGDAFGILTIHPPLGGSGPAMVWIWGDSLLVISVSATADTIAWLALRQGDSFTGLYAAVGGGFLGQGGRWRLDPTSRQLSEIRSHRRVVPTDGLLGYIRPYLEVFRAFETSFANPSTAMTGKAPERESVGSAGVAQSASDRLNAYIEREVEARGLMPLIERTLADRGITDPEAARRFGAEAVTTGALRLSPQDQLDRLKAMGKVLLGIPDQACATWAGLRLADRPAYFISQMTDEELQVHAAWSVHALQAELSGDRPRVAQDISVVASNLKEIGQALGSSEAERLLWDFQHQDQLSPAESCWMERGLVRGVLAAPIDRRPTLAASYFLLAADNLPR